MTVCRQSKGPETSDWRSAIGIGYTNLADRRPHAFPQSLAVAYGRLRPAASTPPRSFTVGYSRLKSVMVGYGRLFFCT
jgi:hypothetical protein